MAALLALILDFSVITGFFWFLTKFDHSAKVSKTQFAIICSMSIPGVIVAYCVERFGLPYPQFGPNGRDFLYFVCIGIIEESCKSIPVLLLMWKKRYFRDYTNGIIYFAIAGQCFSLLEDLEYLVLGGGNVGLFRIILDPFFHATTCAIFGFSVARYKIRGTNPFVMVGGFTCAFMLHGIYDFLLSTDNAALALLGLVVGFSTYAIITFLYFFARREDLSLGLAWRRKSSFCRACGAPTPRHLLFCTQCGTKNA